MPLDEARILSTLAPYLANPLVLADDTYMDTASGWVMTTDLLIENQHFCWDYCSVADVAHKALAVNLSDLAATGAQPRLVLVSLGLPPGVGSDTIATFYATLKSLCQQYRCQIVGGDTVAAPTWVINITALGTLPEGHTPGRRAGAQPGDFVITTGPHGLSAVGLWALQNHVPGLDASKQAHRRPTPHVAAGLWLSGHYRRYALMDTSDGLADAALKIAAASNVSVVLEASQLAIHPELQSATPPASCRRKSESSLGSPQETLLYGGEDFELLACVPELVPGWERDFQVIGRVEAVSANAGQPSAWLVTDQAERLRLDATHCYQHFRESAP
jgi:thiamine-monophosphate kinase